MHIPGAMNLQNSLFPQVSARWQWKSRIAEIAAAQVSTRRRTREVLTLNPYFDKNLVELHQGDRPPQTLILAVVKDEINGAGHLR